MLGQFGPCAYGFLAFMAWLFLLPVAINGDKPPVIFIHRILGSKLYATGTNVQYRKGFEECEKNFRLEKIWLDFPKIVFDAKCTMEQLKLNYNESSGQFENLPGLEIDVNFDMSKWGSDRDPVFCLWSNDAEKLEFRKAVRKYLGTGRIEDEDILRIAWKALRNAFCAVNSKFNVFNSDVYAETLFKMLSSRHKLSVGDGLYVAAYDWRHNYNSDALKPYYHKLTGLVEDAVRNHKRKVTFVAHSMGNLVLAHFLALKDNAWLKANVHATVNVAPPYGGTVLMMNVLFNSLDSVGLGSGLFRFVQQHFLDDAQINHFFRSTPSAAVLLPRPLGFGQTEHYRILELRRNFGAKEMEQFLHYVELPEMAKIYRQTLTVKLPSEKSIEMHCVYSDSGMENTPTAFVLNGKGQTFVRTGKGDKRVNMESMEEPCKWFQGERKRLGVDNVFLHRLKDLDHMDVLSDSQTLNVVADVLDGVMGLGQGEDGKKFKAMGKVKREKKCPTEWEGELKLFIFLIDFLETLPACRREMRKASGQKQNTIKNDPEQLWTYNKVYRERGWRTIRIRNEEEFGLKQLLTVARKEADLQGRDMALLEPYMNLIQPSNGVLPEDLQLQNWMTVTYRAKMTNKLGWLSQSLTALKEQANASLQLELRLIPLAVLLPSEVGKEAEKPKEDWWVEEWRESEEEKKRLKLVVLAVGEFENVTSSNKTVDQMIKVCEHVLLAFSDPKLVLADFEISRLPIGTQQIQAVLAPLGFSRFVTFLPAPPHANWTGRLVAVANASDVGQIEIIGQIIDEFMALIESEWGLKVEGGNATEFGLIRAKLTDDKLGANFGVKLKKGIMQQLRLVWQKRSIQSVAFDVIRGGQLDNYAWSIQATLAKVPDWPNVRSALLAKTGEECLLLLLLCPDDKALEGILRVDMDEFINWANRTAFWATEVAGTEVAGHFIIN